MTTAPTVTPTAHRAADDLTAIREQWGDLLAAIGRPPASEWPPRRTQDRVQDEARTDEPTVGRLPLTLREHPAPVNLDALDAALAVEEALFVACDVIALRVQRPIRPAIKQAPGGRYTVDPDDATHPDRWQLPTHRSATLVQGAGISGAGSRAYGLHWAAVWLENRITQQDDTDLHVTVPAAVLADLAEVTSRARDRIDRALQRDGREHDLPDPCPYCGGTLTARIPPRQPDRWTITCQTGPTCEGPGRYDDRARRQWVGRELTTIGAAILAARGRVEQQA